MTSFGPVQRPSTTNQDPASSMDRNNEEPEKDHSFSLSFTWPFAFPSTAEAAGIRIVKNLVSFGMLYLHFVYVVLFITLIPERKVSLVFLAGMREIGFLFILFLRALPKSLLPYPYRTVFKVFVLFLLSIGAGIAVILTKAGLHLLITVVSCLLVILFHATLWREDYKFGGNDDAGRIGYAPPEPTYTALSGTIDGTTYSV